jgi:hypothetical protein
LTTHQISHKAIILFSLLGPSVRAFLGHGVKVLNSADFFQKSMARWFRRPALRSGPNEQTHDHGWPQVPLPKTRIIKRKSWLKRR